MCGYIVVLVQNNALKPIVFGSVAVMIKRVFIQNLAAKGKQRVRYTLHIIQKEPDYTMLKCGHLDIYNIAR